MYDAIFFDLDGTLIDSEVANFAAGMGAFTALGLIGAEELLHQMIGVDMPTGKAMTTARYPGIDLAALDHHWNAAYKVATRDGLPLKSGAKAVLDALGARFTLGLVTSSGRDSAHAKLDQTGLAPAFRIVVTLDDVTAAKPAPDPYLAAARTLGADPARCLVFEDSEPGAQAAWAAGMRVVQVPDVIPASGRYAHHVAADLMSGATWAGIWP